MFEITILVAAVLVVLAVPSLRRAVLSIIGLVAVIVAGSAIVAVVVWGLYQAKPWLTPDELAVAEEAEVSDGQGSIPDETVEADLTSAIASEEAQRRKEEQQRLEVAQARIASLAARARVILEEDRILAEQAAAYPLPSGLGPRLGNIIAIRIPAWRDADVAARQREAIRAWLHSIGLTDEETLSITTAKAWGGLHDMWVAETTGVLARGVPVAEPTVASDATTSEAESESALDSEANAQAGAGADPLADPAAESVDQPEPLPVAPRPVPRQVFRPAPPPRRADYPPPPPPPPPPRRQPSAQPEVGPFGY